MGNVFDKFKLKEKEIKVEALGNTKVTIREMSVAQSGDFYHRMFSADETGSLKVNTDAIVDIKLDKVASCMIEPKMTVKQLNELGASVNEILTFISGEIDKLSSEGN
jgi:phage-related protein